MINININDVQVMSVAEIISQLRLERHRYVDEKFYPPEDTNREIQLGYFMTMVAIDHRTSTPLGPFEGVIDGEFYHGADLLYRLGKRVFDEDPTFFSAENLVNLDEMTGLRLFKIGDKKVWDYELRLFLLRDIGQKVIEYYDGEFRKLFELNTITELINRLSIFRAYEDPVHKKIFLLAKFLDGRKLIRFKDPENFEVPVDNHISRIAIRLGIVTFSNYDVIKKQIELTRDEDIRVRLKIRESWKEVSKKSGCDPFTLDDFLWSFGRTICLREKPKCNECAFRDVCLANRRREYWLEHRHIITWYY